MNVENFLSGFETLSRFGITISSEKRLLLYNSLILLQNDTHFKKNFLWGIIQGITADYYIAYGYQEDPLLNRVFYYSTNCLDWFILPEPKLDDIQYALMCDSKFQGDPSFAAQIEFDDPNADEILRNASMQKGSIEGESAKKPSLESPLSEQGAVDPINAIKSEGKIKEEDRLAAVIFMINQEVVVIPRGALFKRFDNVIVENKAYEGLKMLESDELRSYLHYRVPQEKWNTNLLTRKDYNYAIDFLDTIDSDKPQGVWRMRLMDGLKLSFLQNLLWTGYIFYHYTETPNHGSFYYGDGKKNLDVPFML